jgi:hypothetical protein
MTPQSITIVLFKKNMSARRWPRLSKTMLAYVETDFSRCTWKGDESDDVEEDGSTDIINVDMDGSSAGMISGGLPKQVFALRVSSQVYDLANGNKSQINQLRPVSQPP